MKAEMFVPKSLPLPILLQFPFADVSIRLSGIWTHNHYLYNTRFHTDHYLGTSTTETKHGYNAQTL